MARGQESLALPAPLPVELAAGPQLERDATVLINCLYFCVHKHYILILIIEESLRLRPSKVSPDIFLANVAETTLPELMRDMSCK